MIGRKTSGFNQNGGKSMVKIHPDSHVVVGEPSPNAVFSRLPGDALVECCLTQRLYQAAAVGFAVTLLPYGHSV